MRTLNVVVVSIMVLLPIHFTDKTMCHVDWERTSLKPYVDMLERHSMGLMEEVRRSKIGKTGS